MSALTDLARRMGIVDEYVDQSGSERRKTSDETRAALLAAWGVEAHDESACRRSLDALVEKEHSRLIVCTEVVRAGGGFLDVAANGTKRWTLTIRLERGSARTIHGVGAPRRIDLGSLAEGHHEIELSLDDADPIVQRRIVTPARCPSLHDISGKQRAFGIAAQLYAVRGTTNWGVGDMHDLEALVRHAGTWGASFVGLNPLHAITNEGTGISPYSPVSRLFRNPLYLAIASIPEAAGTIPDEVVALRTGPRVDYEAVWNLKKRALREAFGLFERLPKTHDRRLAFDAYLRHAGDDLLDFATHRAMNEADRQSHPLADTAYIDAFRTSHAQDIAFQSWMQFELDRQLSGAAGVAKESGLALGLYQDLAIGCAPDAADAWANPGLFLREISIGAPPDTYSTDGQNWGLPPLDPHRLRETGYRYWTSLVRHALAHSGALRIDHVIGLFLQFWIPSGMTGKQGAFVRFPSEDLLGILALEASRARALVVGEDLGTVPPEVPAVLARFGVLSSRVLYFEMKDGAFSDASTYPENALTTANTHDMAPLTGWWIANDVELKQQASIIDETAAAKARSQRKSDRDALVDRLKDDDLLDDAPEQCDASFIGAVHAFLASTPSTLVGLSLDDVLGEVEPVNLPGADLAHHPSWQRKYSVDVERFAKTTPAIPDSLRRR